MTTPTEALSVLGSSITLKKVHTQDFLSLTDIARYKNAIEPNQVIRNRLRNRSTLDFLGLREKLNNELFKPVEFDGFKKDAGENAFTLSPQGWIEQTGAIGMLVKSGRHHGGTFAHKDIALKFASRISVEFELYLIKEYQRLKETEMQTTDWNVKRLIAKVNYRIHTDAIQEVLLPRALTNEEKAYIYADEADMLNLALFGMTAKQRRVQHPKLTGNMRDYATLEQLIVLSNIESINAELIRQGFSSLQRISFLNTTAIKQMRSLLQMRTSNELGDIDKNSLP